MRVAAAESMPLLLECARVRGPEYLTQMWHFMCDALIKAIGTEPDSDVLSEIMHSFAKVLRFTLVFIKKKKSYYFSHLMNLLYSSNIWFEIKCFFFVCGWGSSSVCVQEVSWVLHICWCDPLVLSLPYVCLSFTQCIELMGDGCLNSEHFEEMGGILKSKLEEHFKNQELRQGELWSQATKNELFHQVQTIHSVSFCTAKRQDEDYDEQVEETLQDEVSVLLYPSIRVFKISFRCAR